MSPRFSAYQFLNSIEVLDADAVSLSLRADVERLQLDERVKVLQRRDPIALKVTRSRLGIYFDYFTYFICCFYLFV